MKISRALFLPLVAVRAFFTRGQPKGNRPGFRFFYQVGRHLSSCYPKQVAPTKSLKTMVREMVTEPKTLQILAIRRGRGLYYNWRRIRWAKAHFFVGAD